MAAGYKMASRELEQQLADYPQIIEHAWPFDAMIKRLGSPLAADHELDVDLVVAKERFFKPVLRAMRRRSRGGGASGKALGTAKAGAGRAGHLVALPVRAAVGAPVALLAAAATRVYLATLGRGRRS